MGMRTFEIISKSNSKYMYRVEKVLLVEKELLVHALTELIKDFLMLRCPASSVLMVGSNLMVDFDRLRIAKNDSIPND